MKMFKLMQIYATIDASVDAPSGEGVRCLIMADNTDESLPTDGGASRRAKTWAIY